MSQSRRITVNGQEFNGPQQFVDGVEWEITEVTGLGDPASTSTAEQNVGSDGGSSTTGFRTARTVGLVGVIRAVDEVRAELAADLLRHLIALTDFPITLHYASGDRTVWVRRDQDVQFPSRDLPTEFPWSVTLRADDPAIYAGDAFGSGHLVRATGLGFSTGGLTYPISYPITYTGASATGDATVVLGAGGGKLSVRVAGACLNPSVTVENSLGTFRLAWLGLLAEDLYLDVDPDRRECLLNGQTSRVPNVRQWPKLAPGLNTIRFRAAEYSASASLTANIRPTL